jgi:hypothetical protein
MKRLRTLSIIILTAGILHAQRPTPLETQDHASSATSSAVPSSAIYVGVNLAGNLRGMTAVNPTGSVIAGQVDITSVNGSVVATAATGILKVGAVGNAGVALDAAQAGTAPANELVVGAVYNTTSPNLTSGQATQLQADINGNLKMACTVGCGAGDVAGTAGTLNALDTNASVGLAGNQSASLQLLSGNTLVGTLLVDYSFDGGTTWQSGAGFIRQDGANVWKSSFAASSTVGAFHVLLPGGATNARVRVNPFTSGTATVTLRAVTQPEPFLQWHGVVGQTAPTVFTTIGGTDGTNGRVLKTDTTGDLMVVGTVASGATDSGSPVKISGVFNTTQPTVTNGQRVDAQATNRGAIIVATGVDVFTVTANAGSNLNTSLLAVESGGNLATIASAVRAEDSVSADADKGIGALAIRKATPANTSGADGDYEYLQINAGRLWTSTVIDTALPAGSAVIGKVTTDQTTHGTTDLVAADITKVGGSAISLGSKTAANSFPVVIASDQGLALDATLTGGTAKGIVRGGQKGSTNTNADITHTPSGANHELIDIGIYDGLGNQITTFGGGTQYADGTVQGTPTGTVAMGKDPSNVIKSFALDAAGRLITACGTGCNASSGGLLGTPLYVQPPGDLAYGSVKPGLAASNSALMGAIYNASPPLLTGGQQTALSVDRLGRLIVAPPTSLPPVKITVDGNSTVGSPTQPLYTATVPATQPPSYHATTGATGFAAVNTAATDIFTIGGSSTAGVAILVTRLQVSCTQTTAGIIGLQVIKRSTADSAGTNITETPDDSKFGASGATVAQYTANPTVGTAVGNGVDAVQIGCLAAGTAAANDMYLNILPKPIILRGITEQLAINLNGQSLTGNKFTITVEYMAIAGI